MRTSAKHTAAARAASPSAKPKPSTAVAKAEPKPAPARVSGRDVSVASEAIEALGASMGMEHVSTSDLIIPRLTILQALSPQVNKSKPEFIKGASVGDFCDTATGDLFSGSIQIIPCFFARVFLEWAPRSTGKGLVKNHGLDNSILSQCEPDDKGRMFLPNKNYIAETATYYVINLTAGGRRSFIPLSSTQLKSSRQWMTKISSERLSRRDGSEFTPPIFFRSWHAQPVAQSNAHGSWRGWKFTPDAPTLELDPSQGLRKDCISFYEQARDGIVQGDVVTHEDVIGAAKVIDGETM